MTAARPTIICGVADFDPEAAVAAAVHGDQQAWESIVSAYSGLVWAVARGFGLSAADAADVFQGTWLRLVEHLGDIRDTASLGGWLTTATRREALALLRRASRSLPVDDVDEMVSDTALAIDDGLLLAEEHRAVWQAFGRLSGNCQRLLRIAFADPPPRYEEISAALGMPIGSIGPTRARCLASLKALFAQVTDA
jgi:RNA polymerase sigma factor (sigma-70 family)